MKRKPIRLIAQIIGELFIFAPLFLIFALLKTPEGFVFACFVTFGKLLYPNSIHFDKDKYCLIMTYTLMIAMCFVSKGLQSYELLQNQPLIFLHFTCFILWANACIGRYVERNRTIAKEHAKQKQIISPRMEFEDLLRKIGLNEHDIIFLSEIKFDHKSVKEQSAMYGIKCESIKNKRTRLYKKLMPHGIVIK